MRLISKLIRRKQHQNIELTLDKNSCKNNVQHSMQTNEPTYKMRFIYVAQLAQKDKEHPNICTIYKNIVKKDALLVSINLHWFMDVETGVYYKFGHQFGKKVDEDELCIAGESPMWYVCNETLKSMNIKPDDLFTASELREIYNKHAKNSLIL